MFRALALSASLALAAPGLWTPAAAQEAHPKKQPYADLVSRPVKGLSEERIADLRAGRGMGLALAAELNGYPGPLHTLENAEALMLSPAQRERTQALFDAMKAEVVPLGEQLIEQETQLDQLFATKTVTPESLDAATGAIGTTEGALRAAHLRYHLAMVEVLTPEQVRRYGEIRGYTKGHSQQGHGHGAHAH